MFASEPVPMELRWGARVPGKWSETVLRFLRSTSAMVVSREARTFYGILSASSIWICAVLIVAVPSAFQNAYAFYPTFFRDSQEPLTLLFLLAIDLVIIYFLVSDSGTYELLAKRGTLATVAFCLLGFFIIGTIGTSRFRNLMDAHPLVVIAASFLFLVIPRAVSYAQPVRGRKLDG